MADPTLFPSDIIDAVKIIDHAAEQGAFRGWENIRQILVVRDRLQVFADAVQQSEGATQTDATLIPSDIIDAVKIIDHAAEQGAFRGWENIRQILMVRDRLHAWTVSVHDAVAATTSPESVVA